MFIDSVSLTLMTLPVIFPTIVALGLDPIWFGAIMVKFVQLGLIMPPVGMNLYVIKRIAPDSSMLDIYKGVLVFAVAPLIGASPLFTIFFSFLINHSLETFTIRVILGAVSVVAGTVILFGF